MPCLLLSKARSRYPIGIRERRLFAFYDQSFLSVYCLTTVLSIFVFPSGAPDKTVFLLEKPREKLDELLLYICIV